MKRTVALILILIMVFTLGFTAFAAEGNFLESPGKQTPTVVDVQTDIADYDGKIIIIPYHKKDSLPTEESQLMDKAYDDIAGKGSNPGSNLDEIIGQIANETNTAKGKLGVLDLFDIHEVGHITYNAGGKYTVTLAVTDPNSFKSIIYMDKDGQWHTIPGLKLSDDRSTVTFSVTTLSAPFAIVAENSGTSPKTADSGVGYMFIVIASLSAAAALFFCGKKVRLAR